MAVANTNSSVSYDCDGGTLEFPTTFKFLAAGDLLVTVNDNGAVTTPVLGVDYSVTGAGADEPGGSVVFNDGSLVVSDAVLTIKRVTPIVQPVVLAQSGPIPVRSLSGELDRLTLIEQELARRISALEAGGSPVTLASAIVTDTFVVSEPVENSFPRDVACVGVPKEVALFMVQDLTDASTINQGLGLADIGGLVLNQFTVKYVPGLVPGHNTKLYFLVIT